LRRLWCVVGLAAAVFQSLCFVARGGAGGGGVCVVGLWVLARLGGLGGVVVLWLAVGFCGFEGYRGGPA
jgi:hypothetical protein